MGSYHIFYAIAKIEVWLKLDCKNALQISEFKGIFFQIENERVKQSVDVLNLNI